MFQRSNCPFLLDSSDLIEQIVVNGLVKLQFTKEKDQRFMQAI